MDTESKEMMEVAGKALAEGTTRAFLETIFGTAVELSEYFRDKVRAMRVRSQIKMLVRANEYLEEQGIPANQVSLKLLVPLLELSWLEDESDDEMLDRWAALLANAAAGTERGATVLPSFPRILNELSPEEAAILDILYTDAHPERVPDLFNTYSDDPRLDRDDPLFYTRCFNLGRLGLLEAGWENQQVGDSDPPVYKHIVSRLSGTALGLSFVLACRPPSGD